MSIQKISFIGAGRVATQLAISLHQSGKTILQVYSRNHETAKELASKTHAEPISDIAKFNADADLYIISVVDDAIEEVAGKLTIQNKTLVHTSGSVQMDVLANSSLNYGVFYPLQTFAKNKTISFINVPICIEGSNKAVENDLWELAKSMSCDVRLINSEQRILIHIAAVFANNFTNFMYLMGEEIVRNAGVSFDILLPLIEETAKKANHTLPHLAQTGPAARGDLKIIQKHLEMLKAQPEKSEIYRHISKYILEHFHNQNLFSQ